VCLTLCSARWLKYVFLMLLIGSAPSLAGGYFEANKIQEAPGTDADIAFAQQLWLHMEKSDLVGPDATPLKPFKGAAPPHGWILELASQPLLLNNHNGFLVVKKNYNGDDLTVEDVVQDRASYLNSYTIMYQREDGYDEDNQNWFWAKYQADGSLFSANMQGNEVKLAGRLVKGKTRNLNTGCLYCHSSAGGGDYIFYPHILQP